MATNLLTAERAIHLIRTGHGDLPQPTSITVQDTSGTVAVSMCMAAPEHVAPWARVLGLVVASPYTTSMAQVHTSANGKAYDLSVHIFHVTDPVPADA